MAIYHLAVSYLAWLHGGNRRASYTLRCCCSIRCERLQSIGKSYRVSKMIAFDSRILWSWMGIWVICFVFDSVFTISNCGNWLWTKWHRLRIHSSILCATWIFTFRSRNPTFSFFAFFLICWPSAFNSSSDESSSTDESGDAPASARTAGKKISEVLFDTGHKENNFHSIILQFG